MKAGLLDVNVLIALLDPQHLFHDAAHDWFGRNRQWGWATCPITQNACLRILGKAGYQFGGFTVGRVREILAALVAAEGHEFWADSISILDRARFELSSAGPKNITDLYLLGLAKSHSGRLITFDKTIPWRSVPGCLPDDLDILPNSIGQN